METSSPGSSDASYSREEAQLEPGTPAYDSWNETCCFLSKYSLGAGEPTEDLYSIGFGPGGYLGIHIGELFRNRYKVVHKLGSGKSSSVWLCRDLQGNAWRALRVHTANASASNPYMALRQRLRETPNAYIRAAHLVLPTDDFILNGHGQNKHLCLIFPFLGPPITRIRKILEDAPDLDKRLRRICYQAVEAMSFMHQSGFCHGGKGALSVELEVRSNIDASP